MNLRIKGAQYMKRQNIPTIILSNYAPHQAYKNIAEHDADKLDTLLARLLVIGPIDNIHFPVDFWDFIIKDPSIVEEEVNTQELSDVGNFQTSSVIDGSNIHQPSDKEEEETIGSDSITLLGTSESSSSSFSGTFLNLNNFSMSEFPDLL